MFFVVFSVLVIFWVVMRGPDWFSAGPCCTGFGYGQALVNKCKRRGGREMFWGVTPPSGGEWVLPQLAD